MGLFDFNRKKEESKETTRDEFMRRFEGYIKELLDGHKDNSFFMLVGTEGFAGKAIKGDSAQLEDLFCQLFDSHPELLEVIEEIASKFKSGKASYSRSGRKQELSDDIIKSAEKHVKREDINNGKVLKQENPLDDLLKGIFSNNSSTSEKKPDINDPLYPKYEMKKLHDKEQEKLDKKGLADYDISDIIKRNK